MAIEPLTAGTKYRARKTWMPRSLRLTTIARQTERAMIVGVTSR